MSGTFGLTPEFDNYGMNAVWMWYDSLDAQASCWMMGETHSYTYLDENGDLVCHEADLGPDAVFPQPLGPHIADLQGPRPLSDAEDPSAWYGFSDA